MWLLWLALMTGCGDDDQDGDGVSDDKDCEVAAAAVYPGAAERCNGVDDDCDGQIDEDFDADEDGAPIDVGGCAASGKALDCDDEDPAIGPEIPEICNGIDDDCSGTIDDAADGDGDGTALCDDCDDDDRAVHPGAAEACDGLDNDCSGAADEPWDEDGDGVAGCAGDCDDRDPQNGPNLAEICDSFDNNCDGVVDEGFDADADGQTTCRGDCDDNEPLTYLGSTEVCDGVDNDCDPSTVEDEDLDADGFSLCAGDCSDLDAAASPAGTEVCDGLDNNCDGNRDELPECWACVESGPYLACTTYASWGDAEATCVAFGRHLVTIDDAAENQVIADIGVSLFGNYPWIGLSDGDVEGTMAWSSGAPVNFTAWWPGEPNDSGGEDCVSNNFGDIGYWNDWPCATTLPFVCE